MQVHTLGGSAIATASTLTGYFQKGTTMFPVYYNAGRSIYLCAADANTSYIDFRFIDTSTAGPDVRIQASGGTAGSSCFSILNFYGSALYLNRDASTVNHNFTCGVLTCTIKYPVRQSI